MAENPADKAKQDALYEDREPKKIIRIITVTAYMISVSFVGIVLSTYYIFLWNPPNPRLMHAQAIAAHSERLMDDGPLASRRFADDRIDLMPAGDHPEPNDDESRLKARRQIVENVNAILRANYERNRLLATPGRSTAAPATLDDDISANSSSSSFLLDNATSSTPEPSPTSPAGSTSPVVSEPSVTSAGSAESPTTTPPKPSRSFAKKQHQTPFALKHLQEPIKFEGLRKRPTRIMTTTRMPTTTTTTTTELSTASTLTPAVDSSEAKGNSGDKAAPAFTTMETFNSAESSSPSQPSRSLYKILTTPAYRRNEDEASLSSDQPERFAPEQREDYQDGTIVPADAILDD